MNPKKATLKELKAFMKEKGIKGYSRFDRKRSEMIVGRILRPESIEQTYVKQNHASCLLGLEVKAKLTHRQGRRLRKAVKRANKAIRGEL